MVSPFMSFATGALQEVGRQIDKYQAQEYQQEQQEAAAEREDAKMRLANQLEGDLRVKLKEMDQRHCNDRTRDRCDRKGGEIDCDSVFWESSTQRGQRPRNDQ